MVRHKKVLTYKRPIGVDMTYGSELIQKFINVLMWRGKKNVARDIAYEALEVLVKKSGGDKVKGLQFFEQAFNQIVPAIEVRPRRVGGGVYQIPMAVEGQRGKSLAMRWLIGAAASRPEKTMGQRLAHELLDAREGRGNAIKKKMDMHKMAESNRAFSHYAW